MDSNEDIEPTGRSSSDLTLTAYHQRATDTPADQLPSSQSQNNLRQASVALDAAYERITQLRNSINNMLNRMPPEVYGTTTSSPSDTNITQARRPLSSEANIRPPHSALVLSGGEQAVQELNVRAQRLRSLVSPTARQRLEEFESGSRDHARREFIRDRLSQADRTRPVRGDVQRVPLRPHTPPMPDLVIPRARNFVETRATLRREFQGTNLDESSTMIGRRVAARINANAGATNGQGSGSTRLSLSQIEQRLQDQTDQIARELENMTGRLASQRFRRVELALSGGHGRGANAPVTTSQDDVASTPSAGQRIPGVWSLSSPPDFSSNATLSPLSLVDSQPPRPPTRDVILVDNTTHIVLPSPTSHISSDGTPVEGHGVSAPVRRSLSAAYREHVANLAQESARDLATAPEVRGTLLEFLTRDRVDQFFPSGQPDPVRPGSEPSGRDNTSTGANPPSQAGPTRRRRGWSELYFPIPVPVSRLTQFTARLDANGDELDTDDEESTHARRLRMRPAHGTPSTDQTATRFNIGTIEDILWQTSGSMGSDSEADALSPEATGNAESCHVLVQSPPTWTDTRHSNPLPTPAEEMLVYPTIKPPQQRPRVARVSKYASLAGR
ncbi:hypothetical protein BS17DRAFT_877100 [Gyrodon lividus]|nr:hypothetical protein BS17DRAFT_877100 [Gyrodon lividus]